MEAWIDQCDIHRDIRMPHDEAIRRLHTGDNTLVPASDAILEHLEGTLIHTKKWRNVDDCCGSIPNVPAMLAGHPMAMRRRARLDRDDAPINVYVDLTSSMGVPASDLIKRGAAILAFVRLLSDHRATTLWAGTSMNSGYEGSGTCAWQIDTAPLDLARAAFMLSHVAMSRGFGYAVVNEEFKSTGHWPFCDYSKHCRTMEDRLRGLLGTEIIYIKPVYLGDDLIHDPLTWIRHNIDKYTHREED